MFQIRLLAHGDTACIIEQRRGQHRRASLWCAHAETCLQVVLAAQSEARIAGARPEALVQRSLWRRLRCGSLPVLPSAPGLLTNQGGAAEGAAHAPHEAGCGARPAPQCTGISAHTQVQSLAGGPEHVQGRASHEKDANKCKQRRSHRGHDLMFCSHEIVGACPAAGSLVAHIKCQSTFSSAPRPAEVHQAVQRLAVRLGREA